MHVFFRLKFLFLSVLFLAVNFSIAEKAVAIEKYIQLGMTIEHSDDALRSETTPRSDLEQRTELDIQLAERTPHITGVLDYNFEYSEYARETNDDGESIEGRAELIWHMLPERLDWSVSNVSDDLIRDTRGADTRNNRELRNIFTTGPTLTLSPSPVDDIQVDAEFTRSNFEESSSQDSERLSGQTNWTHRTPHRLNTVFAYRYDEVDYLDSPIQNIVGQTVYAGIERQILRGQYDIAVGYDYFDIDGQGDIDGLMLNAGAFYSLPGAHSLEFAFVHGLTETSLGLSGEDALTEGELSTGDAVATGGVDVVRRTRYDLFYRYDGECRLCDSGIDVFYSKRDFNVLLEDESSYGFGPRLSYRSSQNITWILEPYYGETRFPNEAALRVDRVYDVELTMEYRPSNRWQIEVSAESNRRDSNIEGLDYDDLVGTISIRYGLFGSESSVTAISSEI